MYSADFQHNVEVAKTAEGIAKEILEKHTKKTIVDVSRDPECYHKGDLLVGEKTYIDVKDDTLIHKTGNVFVETLKIWPSGAVTNGWVTSQYNYLAIVSQPDQKFYLIDFKALKQCYKQIGRFVKANNGDNITQGYVCSLKKLRDKGVVKFETSYISHVYDDI